MLTIRVMCEMIDIQLTLHVCPFSISIISLQSSCIHIHVHACHNHLAMQ